MNGEQMDFYAGLAKEDYVSDHRHDYKGGLEFMYAMLSKETCRADSMRLERDAAIVEVEKLRDILVVASDVLKCVENELAHGTSGAMKCSRCRIASIVKRMHDHDDALRASLKKTPSCER